MALFDRLFKSRDKPVKNTLLGNNYSFLFGSTSSGKTVNERTALQTTAVYACVRILSETIASLPLHTYRYTDRGKDKALDHPLYREKTGAGLSLANSFRQVSLAANDEKGYAREDIYLRLSTEIPEFSSSKAI